MDPVPKEKLEGGTCPLAKANPCNDVEPLTMESIVFKVVEGKD